MNESDLAQVIKWIEHHGYDRCPQCNVEGNLAIAKNHFVQLIAGKEETTAFIALTCKNCALVRLLNPSIVGPATT